MKHYFVAKTSASGFIGQLSIEDIIARLNANEIKGDCVATESNGPSYAELVKSTDVQWEPVSQLVARLSLPESVTPQISSEVHEKLASNVPFPTPGPSSPSQTRSRITRWHVLSSIAILAIIVGYPAGYWHMRYRIVNENARTVWLDLLTSTILSWSDNPIETWPPDLGAVIRSKETSFFRWPPLRCFVKPRISAFAVLNAPGFLSVRDSFPFVARGWIFKNNSSDLPMDWEAMTTNEAAQWVIKNGSYGYFPPIQTTNAGMVYERITSETKKGVFIFLENKGTAYFPLDAAQRMIDARARLMAGNR